MATNKNASIRYRVLDNCFRNVGRKYFINDLISECENVLLDIDPHSNGISKRQIYDDIAFMESAEGWSIELERHNDGKKVYYRYADMSFSINKMPLNEIEIKQLKDTIDLLSQFKGMPQFEWMNELIPKLKQGMASNKLTGKVMEFESNEFLKGIELLGPLYNAIFYKKVLKVSYQTFENDTPFDVMIHPYFLKQYNNRWFLFGYNPEKEKYDWNLAIDRIISFKEMQHPFLENTVIDWNEYFDDIIGVTKPAGAEVEKVVLQFTGLTAKYIETKPIHGSQKPKWLDKNTLEIRLKIILNYEFERFVLSYADNVKVIEPVKLRNTVTFRLKNALKYYEM
jgi:predicted DNA-binding transcriptional regulator YafY